MAKQYDLRTGLRLTDCCGAASTYCEENAQSPQEVLCCKKCYKIVSVGEGDGNEYKHGKPNIERTTNNENGRRLNLGEKVVLDVNTRLEEGIVIEIKDTWVKILVLKPQNYISDDISNIVKMLR